VAHFGKTDGSNKTDVSRSNNGNFDVFTHSAVVLILIVEDNREQEQSREPERKQHCFETDAEASSSNVPSGRHTRVD
jgi:hypothetical protein